MTRTYYLNAASVLIMTVLSGCTSYGSVDGVSNVWRDLPVDRFERGTTTQAEVLDLLGPPSQLIKLHDQTVFYYLAQQDVGEGKIFVFWNRISVESEYDRAVFFFGEDGVLQEFAYSKEEIER